MRVGQTAAGRREERETEGGAEGMCRSLARARAHTHTGIMRDKNNERRSEGTGTGTGKAGGVVPTEQPLGEQRHCRMNPASPAKRERESKTPASLTQLGRERK